MIWLVSPAISAVRPSYLMVMDAWPRAPVPSFTSTDNA